jgi:ABC-type nitrate/sulfonate/bicarbonate transport system substrate-binding protein
MGRMRLVRRLSAAAAIALCGICAARAQEQIVRIGQVRALVSAATFIAVEKGYFKESGI